MMRNRSHPRRPRRPAFTLVEMVVSLLILSVVVVAAGATLTVADNGAGPQAARWLAQGQSADAAAQVADDLTVAANFTERTATAATFTVPDRVAAGSPNTVRYAWDGTAGDPLTRQFNGGPAVPILPATQSFALAYQTRTAGPPADAALPLPTWAVAAPVLATYNLTSSAWAAQAIKPQLPTGTASYSITRVRIPLKSSGAADGALVVQITTVDGSGRPTTTVLGSAVVFEAALSNTTFEPVDVPFAGLTGLVPGTTYCISIGYLFGTATVGSIQYIANTVSGVYGVPMSTSANGGSTWTADPTYVFQPFAVFGTVP